MDLGNSDGIQPALDDAPDGRESPRGVDQVELTQALGVVVLRDDGDLADVVVDRGDLGQCDALEIHDAAAGFKQGAGLARAGRETRVRDTLILDGQVREHALSGGDLVHGVQVNSTESLNVQRTAILERMCECMSSIYKNILIQTLSVLW